MSLSTNHQVSIRSEASAGFWFFFMVLKAVPWSRRYADLKSVALPFLGFFFSLFSPSALSSSHSPSPFRRWNASKDRSVIMMCPFSKQESATSKTATTCEDRYLHMWAVGTTLCGSVSCSLRRTARKHFTRSSAIWWTSGLGFLEIGHTVCTNAITRGWRPPSAKTTTFPNLGAPKSKHYIMQIRVYNSQCSTSHPS